MSLKLRRGTNAERLAITPEQGELIYTTDTKQLYAGDGSTPGGTLVSYNGSIGGPLGSDLDLATNNLIGTGNINIAGTITSTGNIVSGGNITATGSIFAQGNIELGNASSDTIKIDGEIDSNFIPKVTTAYDLGTSLKRWRNIFASDITGDLKGSVRSDDGSSILVDAGAGVLRGQLEGNLIGPVQGNVAGNVTGDLTGSIRNENGTVILSNGSDTNPATFYGNVVGNVTGGVSDAVLTTGQYFDPSWLESLNASKIIGTLDKVYVIGDVTGSVFANDSTLLVDGSLGVLRGPHFGELTTIGEADGLPKLTFSENTIAAVNTNENINIVPQGAGIVTVSGTVRADKVEVNTTGTSGISILVEASTKQGQTIFTSHDTAAVSTSTGASMVFARGRGTTAAPVAVNVGDEIASVVFSALTATSPSPTFSKAVNLVAKTGSTVQSGQLSINVANTAGTSTEVLVVDENGVLEFANGATQEIAASGVSTGSPVKWVKVKMDGVTYAMPLYALV